MYPEMPRRRVGRDLQAAGDVVQDVHGVSEQVGCFPGFALGEEFEEQRHVVGQLAGDGLEALRLVLLEQVDHGLAAGAVFAVDVLEQVQRVRGVAVEGGDVFFLEGDEVAGFEVGDERFDLRGDGGVRGECGTDLAERVEQVLLGVAQQGREGLKVHGGHGVCSLRPGPAGCRVRAAGWRPAGEKVISRGFP